MNKMNTPMNILLDLSKSFDTLDYKILLDIYEHYRVNGVLQLHWIDLRLTT